MRPEMQTRAPVTPLRAAELAPAPADRRRGAPEPEPADRRPGAADRRAPDGSSPDGRRTIPRGPDRRRRFKIHHRSNRHLRDALTGVQRCTLLVLIVGWLCAIVYAWHWWLAPGHIGEPVGAAFNSVLLALDTILLPGWFLGWLWRMRRPDPSLPAPELAVAMIVTKAPSEPWAVVRETLEAMLAQDYPYAYDVWLADEQPAPETYSWCHAHGVRISTRYGVAAYHRPTWPRRTKCKEGNLAYFYDHWGYECYEVVAQLDADHVPEAGYLRHIVGPFRDPHVGYVAAPSICDRNAAKSWSARARLYAEAVFHGPLQAGHSGGGAPSMIGSHYAVRTAALKEIGGLGPELAEDFTTTLMMSSHGWQGVFAVDARAHGDGPQTIDDFVVQEFQWSRSMMNVLLNINGRYWRGLSKAAKVRLGFCQAWYPLVALTMLASVVFPVVALATRTPPMHLSFGGFYAHFAPSICVLLLVLIWLRSIHWLRPIDARPLSWELVMFQLVRWPWVVLGCLHAIFGRITGRDSAFRVTPKGAYGAMPLGLPTVVPYLLLATLAAAPAIMRLDAGAAQGYYLLTLINTGLYLITAAMIVVLHVRDHPRSLKWAVLRLTARTTVAATALGVTIAGAVAAVTPSVLRHPPSPALIGPWPIGTPAEPLLALGVTTRALADNSYERWTPQSLSQVNTFEHAAAAHAAVIMWFADWQHVAVPNLAQLRAVAARGSLPEISWEPWDSSRPLRQPQPAYTLQSIIDGAHDAYIRRWAQALRGYGGPVLLRFAQEMNGSWYPWAEAINGNAPGEFIAAWRHVHDIFAAVGATNVKWIWSPVARYGVSPRTITAFYPGSAYVDEIGFSGFNGGTALSWTGWHTFASLFDSYLGEAVQLAPAKPVQISEVGSAIEGGNRPAWIEAMFDDLSAHPQVTSVLWFDLGKQTDWTIPMVGPDALALATGIRLANRPPASLSATAVRLPTLSPIPDWKRPLRSL